MRIETEDGTRFTICATHRELTKLQVCWRCVREPKTDKERKYGMAVLGSFIKMIGEAKENGVGGNESPKGKEGETK